ISPRTMLHRWFLTFVGSPRPWRRITPDSLPHPSAVPSTGPSEFRFGLRPSPRSFLMRQIALLATLTGILTLTASSTSPAQDRGTRPPEFVSPEISAEK